MNPKDKKTIGILIPKSSPLTGKQLKQGICQLYDFFNNLNQILQTSQKISIEDYLSAIEDLDQTLLKIIEKEVVNP